MKLLTHLGLLTLLNCSSQKFTFPQDFVQPLRATPSSSFEHKIATIYQQVLEAHSLISSENNPCHSYALEFSLGGLTVSVFAKFADTKECRRSFLSSSFQGISSEGNYFRNSFGPALVVLYQSEHHYSGYFLNSVLESDPLHFVHYIITPSQPLGISCEELGNIGVCGSSRPLLENLVEGVYALVEQKIK